MTLDTLMSVLHRVLAGDVSIERALGDSGVSTEVGGEARAEIERHLLRALAGHSDSRDLAFFVASHLWPGRTVEICGGLAKGLRWIVTPGDNVQYVRGTWDWTFQQVLPLLCPEDGVYFDVGCNRGFDSLLGAVTAKTGAVFAFDPLGEMCAQTRAVLDLNGFGNAQVSQLALRERTGSTDFFKSTISDSLGSVLVPDDGAEAERMTVPCTTLDALAESSRAPQVVKIDVEGAEDLVLAGAEGLLSRPSPPAFLVELHTPSAAQAVLAQLRRHEYRTFAWFEIPISTLSTRNVEHVMAVRVDDPRFDEISRRWTAAGRLPMAPSCGAAS
jgi:FkbM family methyltransferase